MATQDAKSVGFRDRLLAAACAASLLGYLLCSVAVRHFIHEVTRLVGKL